MEQLKARLAMKGKFIVECRDKDGNFKWKDEFKNGVTDAALTDILEKYFRGSAYTAAWYLSLIDASGFTALAAADTMASHAGWAEFQSYSNATRPSWSPAAAANKVITNTTAVAFTMTAGGTIKGFFCATVNTKGGTTGTLWATALFASGDQVVSNGDVLNVTYSVSSGT